MKHRSQILLEEWQYHSLREMAQRMGTNLSALIRIWVTEKIKKRSPKGKKGILSLAGKIRDKSDVARSHDSYLSSD